MPSFDIVSEMDMHELANAVDQANREVSQRYDFKGVDAKFELKEAQITLTAEADFHLQQMIIILKQKMTKRQIDLKHIEIEEPEVFHKKANQLIKLSQGIATDKAKKIIKMIKEQKLKVQTAIQGEELRVTGKKRDDLQSVIAFLRESDSEVPLQFKNFRD
jgi:cyclic-di-GMP-binding protein